MHHISKTFPNINVSDFSNSTNINQKPTFLNNSKNNKINNIADQNSWLIFDQINHGETKYSLANSKNKKPYNDLYKLLNEPESDEIKKCLENKLFIDEKECKVSYLPWPTQFTRGEINFQAFGTYSVPDKTLLGLENTITQNTIISDRIMFCGIRNIPNDVYCTIRQYRDLDVKTFSTFAHDKSFTNDFNEVKVPHGCEIMSISNDQKLARFVGCFTALSKDDSNLSFYLLSFTSDNKSFGPVNENIIKIESTLLDLKTCTIAKSNDDLFFYQQNDQEFKITKFQQEDLNSNIFKITDQKSFPSKLDACRNSPELVVNETRKISESHYHGNNMCVHFENYPILASVDFRKGPTKSWLDGVYSGIILPSFLALTALTAGGYFLKKNNFSLPSVNLNMFRNNDHELNEINLENIQSNFEREQSSNPNEIVRLEPDSEIIRNYEIITEPHFTAPSTVIKEKSTHETEKNQDLIQNIVENEFSGEIPLANRPQASIFLSNRDLAIQQDLNSHREAIEISNQTDMTKLNKYDLYSSIFHHDSESFTNFEEKTPSKDSLPISVDSISDNAPAVKPQLSTFNNETESNSRVPSPSPDISDSNSILSLSSLEYQLC